MKLHLSILEKLIDLPTKVPQELRQLLDDIGLEVKSLDQESAADVIFNIETLANRGDHLSALGVAREISARTLTAPRIPAIAGQLSDRKASLGVSVKTEKCLRYAALELAATEQLELRPEISRVLGDAAKLAERHPLVHYLNYLLLEVGQPMHAFDRDKLEGELIIDELQSEEQIEALDGNKYRVPSGSIVIRDRKKIVAVAGVIGCANSMITLESKRAVIESATFDPVSVRKTAKAMGISTDASFVFERGSDPEMVLFALKRLAYLAAPSGGGGVQMVGLNYVPGRVVEAKKIEITLGAIRAEMNLPRLEELAVVSRLKLLGYHVEQRQQASQSKGAGSKGEVVFHLTVPSWRMWDVANPEDVVEDFARSHGLSGVKQTLPALQYELPQCDNLSRLRSVLDPVLHGNGMFEVITKGFTSAEDVKLLSSFDDSLGAAHLALINSVEGAHSHMKLTNLIHLARVAEANLRKGIDSVKVYEYGRLFQSQRGVDPEYPFERETLTLAVAGRWNVGEWRKAEEPSELLRRLSGVVFAVSRALRCEYSVTESRDSLLHPGAQAGLKFGRSIVGRIGLIHPMIKERLGLKEALAFVELDTGKLYPLLDRPAGAISVSEFPGIYRDLTLKLPLREQAGRVNRLVTDGNLPNLRSVQIVDDFKKADEEFRRVSFRLYFQSAERTLSAEEVEVTIGRLLTELAERHGISLAI